MKIQLDIAEKLTLDDQKEDLPVENEIVESSNIQTKRDVLIVNGVLYDMKKTKRIVWVDAPPNLYAPKFRASKEGYAWYHPTKDIWYRLDSKLLKLFSEKIENCIVSDENYEFIFVTS